jgi:hypothetical protein
MMWLYLEVTLGVDIGIGVRLESVMEAMRPTAVA